MTNALRWWCSAAGVAWTWVPRSSACLFGPAPTVARRHPRVTLSGMRRSAWERAGIAVVAAWLAFNTADPLGLHVYCPMHDGPLVNPPEAAHGAGAPQLSPAHASHDDECHHGPGHPSDHSRHQCLCLGTCCGTAALMVSRERLVALPVVPVEVAGPSVLSTDDTLRPARPDLVLPPPLGPPSLRV